MGTPVLITNRQTRETTANTATISKTHQEKSIGNLPRAAPNKQKAATHLLRGGGLETPRTHSPDMTQQTTPEQRLPHQFSKLSEHLAKHARAAGRPPPPPPKYNLHNLSTFSLRLTLAALPAGFPGAAEARGASGLAPLERRVARRLAAGLLRLIGARDVRLVEVVASLQAVVPLEGVVHVRQHVLRRVHRRENFAVGELVPVVEVSPDAGLDLRE